MHIISNNKTTVKPFEGQKNGCETWVRGTVQCLLASARRKTAEALVSGAALVLAGVEDEPPLPP